MIPSFNDNGHLPPGIHETTLEEFKTRFVDGVQESTTRADVFSGYTRYCADLSKLDLIIKQWLDGSFTTSKVNPNDIDVISHLDAMKIGNNKSIYDQVYRLIINKKHTNRDRLNSKYKCDPFAIFVFPPGHKYYDRITLSDIKYWTEFFGHDTRVSGNPSKGLIELNWDEDE